MCNRIFVTLFQNVVQWPLHECRIMSFWTWHYIVWWKFIDVSKEAISSSSRFGEHRLEDGFSGFHISDKFIPEYTASLLSRKLFLVTAGRNFHISATNPHPDAQILETLCKQTRQTLWTKCFILQGELSLMMVVVVTNETCLNTDWLWWMLLEVFRQIT
jgi:hypothetical protein